jgi:hypothetical protein
MSILSPRFRWRITLRQFFGLGQGTRRELCASAGWPASISG